MKEMKGMVGGLFGIGVLAFCLLMAGEIIYMIFDVGRSFAFLGLGAA